MKKESLLEVSNLEVEFQTRRGTVRAVNGISFSVQRGETLGIVGESGSGKTVTYLSYLRLSPSPPLRIRGGTVYYKGENLLTLPDAAHRSLRGNRISVIFQEPMTSLNPYLRIETQVMEPLLLHRKMSKKEARLEAAAALERVGLVDTQSALRAYPHEFSGGMRQRVAIAMALTTQPDILIADEPTTALDVTVQAQILELLKSIQKETGMAILLISHDLGVVAGVADRVLVMYAGRCFEKGSVDEVFYNSVHPYTRALLRSMPRLDQHQEKLCAIAGSPPDAAQVQKGCPFFERCEHRMPICSEVFPEERVVSSEHTSYCHWDPEFKESK